MRDGMIFRGVFKIEKYAPSSPLPYFVGHFSNILVNVGLAEIWKLVTNQSGTAFSAANAYIGVGDSSAAASVAQTDLQAATNKLRMAMDGGFPNTPVNGLEQWKSTFGSSDANFAWNEFAVFNASSSGTMMNRAVSSQGTKVSGQTWVLTYSITLS